MSDNKLSGGELIAFGVLVTGVVMLVYAGVGAVFRGVAASTETFKDLSSKGKVAFVTVFASLIGAPVAGYKVQDHLRENLAKQGYEVFTQIEQTKLKGASLVNQEANDCIKGIASSAYAKAVRPGIFFLPFGKIGLDDAYKGMEAYKRNLQFGGCMQMLQGEDVAAINNARYLARIFTDSIALVPVNVKTKELLAGNKSVDFEIRLNKQ